MHVPVVIQSSSARTAPGAGTVAWVTWGWCRQDLHARQWCTARLILSRNILALMHSMQRVEGDRHFLVGDPVNHC